MIETIGFALVCILLVAFLITGTLFFMAATVLFEKLSDMFGKVGAIAIPIGGGSSRKPPVVPSNSDPV